MGAILAVLALTFLLLSGTSAAPASQLIPGAGLTPPPLKAVQLFKKPDMATGQLVPVKEGLDVLRAQREPFAIISAVGPTRTGKSSILGRAFMRGEHENLFEIGGGVQSYTGGVWITSSPVELRPPGGGKPVKAFLIDTEGFSGVGGLTSRTYEANLFGIIYLLSSAVIFNSMYPVDASMVERMNQYGKRTLDVVAELNDYNVANKRLMPKLLWTVQSFNLFNLQNSKMTIDQLLSDLKNTSRGEGGAAGGSAGKGAASIKSTSASALLGGRASEATSMFVLESLFREVQLLPVRRPHGEDEIVANLAKYPSSRLNADYLSDAERLKNSAIDGLLPVHRCRDNSSRVPLFPKRCGTVPFTGEQLVEQIGVWLKYGHIIDPSESDEALNETKALADFEETHDLWFQRECLRLSNLLRSKLRTAYSSSTLKPGGGRSSMNETALVNAGEAALQEVLGYVKHLPRKSMARGIEMSTFWSYPSKVATYIETAGKVQTTQCTEELFQIKRDLEQRQRSLGRAPAQKVAPPKPRGANGSEPLRLVKRTEGVTFEMASKARLARVRARAKQLSGDDIKFEQTLGKAREECFVVFD